MILGKLGSFLCIKIDLTKLGRDARHRCLRFQTALIHRSSFEFCGWNGANCLVLGLWHVEATLAHCSCTINASYLIRSLFLLSILSLLLHLLQVQFLDLRVLQETKLIRGVSLIFLLKVQDLNDWLQLFRLLGHGLAKVHIRRLHFKLEHLEKSHVLPFHAIVDSLLIKCFKGKVCVIRHLNLEVISVLIIVQSWLAFVRWKELELRWVSVALLDLFYTAFENLTDRFLNVFALHCIWLFVELGSVSCLVKVDGLRLAIEQGSQLWLLAWCFSRLLLRGASDWLDRRL